jgi:hypothetical protein
MEKSVFCQQTKSGKLDMIDLGNGAVIATRIIELMLK